MILLKKGYNIINVYYKNKNKDSKTRTINSYMMPNGITEPGTSQSSVGSAIAVYPGSTTPISGANGPAINLFANLAEVPIIQVSGYISGYSKDGGNWVAATEIPAITGEDTSTYQVGYVIDPAVSQQDYEADKAKGTAAGIAAGLTGKPASVQGQTLDILMATKQAMILVSKVIFLIKIKVKQPAKLLVNLIKYQQI